MRMTWFAAAFAVLMAAGAAAPAALRAQAQGVDSVSAAPGAPDAESLQRLRARVQERWRVVRTREGLVLVPRRAVATTG